MADLKELAEEMRRCAESSREVGDSYDEAGNTGQARFQWGIAEGYMQAALILDHEIQRAVRDA